MDFTGKPTQGTIYVDPTGTETDAELASWVEAGAAFAESPAPQSSARPQGLAIAGESHCLLAPYASYGCKKGQGDERIAKVAGMQHGVVSTAQLRELGIGRGAVQRRVEAGSLRRLHRGVFAVGHTAPSRQRDWMAAVLACGRIVIESDGANVRRTYEQAADRSTWSMPEASTVLGHWGAALSHRSAAQLWGFLPIRADTIDVSIPGYGGKKKRRKVRAHRSQTLLPAQVTLRDRIPVTTPARTVADLRRTISVPGRHGLISPKELRRAIRQAAVLGLPLGDDEEPDRMRSDLELDFFELCRRHRLPAPEVNVRIGGHLVDFLWRDRRVAVETDSYLYHRGRVAFQDDRARDLDLRALGLQVIRLSEKQVNEEAHQVAVALRRALRVGADAPGSPDAADQPELFLIDGNSLAYRAFFALPESIGTSDGRPTNAIYGLASMLVKIIDEHHPAGRGRRLGRGDVGARGHLRPLQGPAQTAARPAARAVAAPDAAGRGLRLHQRQGRGLRGRRRDRLADPAGARAGDRGDGRDRRPRRLPAGRRRECG